MDTNPSDDLVNSLRKETGVYGDSMEEIGRELKETGAVPILKLSNRPLNSLCHTGDVRMNDEGCFKIDTATCIDQAEWSYRQNKFMPGIEKYLEIFKYKPEAILTVKVPSNQQKKIVGLIEVTVGVLRLAKAKKVTIPLFFEEPETHLHPAQHANVVEFIVQVMKEFEVPTDTKEE